MIPFDWSKIVNEPGFCKHIVQYAIEGAEATMGMDLTPHDLAKVCLWYCGEDGFSPGDVEEIMLTVQEIEAEWTSKNAEVVLRSIADRIARLLPPSGKAREK